MLNEAVKKQLLNNQDYFFVKRWEGKPWSYKFKFAYANYPGFLISAVVILAFMPPVAFLKVYNYPNSYREAIRKYNMVYTVVRDDDPNIKEIKRKKEMGRKFFPKC